MNKLTGFCSGQKLRHGIDPGLQEDPDDDSDRERIDQARQDVGPDQMSLLPVRAGGRADCHDIVYADHVADRPAHALQGYDQDL